MSKKIAISGKPIPKTQSADEWVKDNSIPEKQKMKRLTIDIPESLHREIKSQCALRGSKIADEIRSLLTTHYVS